MNFSEYMSLPLDDKLNEFMNTRLATNRTASYYVNWHKAQENVAKYELELNTLNYLIGKPHIKSEMVKLFTAQPDLLKAIPTLIAARDKVLDVLSIDEDKNFKFYNLNFEEIEIEKLEQYIDFIEETGLMNFLQNDIHQSLVDFSYGVEVGLDSNGRKNRSGQQNESILEIDLIKLTEGTDLEFSTQTYVKDIKLKWGIDVPTDKSSRRFDGVVFNPKTNKVTIIETNFYGGGGSKLKAVSGEFRDLNTYISGENVNFVWISDGPGWNTARLPLTEAFEVIPYIINLTMVNLGYLKEIVDL
ncbi:type II restriction endonuclease [Weissella oryzae]|nr:type II restriction endonuclease [Weissella oryzae]